MKKFLKKVVLFLLCFMIIAVSLFSFDFFVIKNQYYENQQAALLDKVNRLNNIKAPKIVLVGNSNLSYGINSAMIEEALNMPVVNLGLHGGLGNPFNENIIVGGIHKGDIVIVCHTSYSDNDRFPDPSLVWITLEWNKPLYSAVRAKDIPTLVYAYPNYFVRAFKLWAGITEHSYEDEIHKRDNYNEYGDAIKRPENTYYKKNAETPLPKINDICTTRLNKLNKIVTDAGATLLVAGYPIAYTDNLDTEYVSSFASKLGDKLDCEVISDFEDYIFPIENFCDTQFHLDKMGADMRTEQLIDDITQWQKTKSSKMLSVS